MTNLELRKELNTQFSGKTIYEIQELLYKDKVQNPEIKTIIDDFIHDLENLFLFDDCLQNVFMKVSEIMSTLHYDNGQPLSCEYYDYFEHYDRIDDYWTMFNDVPIHNFGVNLKGEVSGNLELTTKDLKRQLKDMYNGSSWSHDFGNKTPDEVKNSPTSDEDYSDDD